MTNITQLHKESDRRTTDFRVELGRAEIGEASATGTAGIVELIQASDVIPSDEYLTVDDFERQFVESFDSKELGQDALKEGRKWVSETYYPDDGI